MGDGKGGYDYVVRDDNYPMKHHNKHDNSDIDKRKNTDNHGVSTDGARRTSSGI
jgi:hypothetical protein